MYTNNFYNEYAKDIHSQNGEDGIVEELLKRLEISNGWVCEFGAWDGIHLSNTFALIEKGFEGVFIEGDKNKYSDLLDTVKKYPNIVTVESFIDGNKDSKNSLDNVLKTTPIPKDFDVLSIDIDSYDYQVWDSLKDYRPKMVIIEIESGVHPNNSHSHIYKHGVYKGTGFRPMFDLGIKKGYTFVLHTGNMFFVRNDLFSKLNISYTNELENFRTNWL